MKHKVKLTGIDKKCYPELQDKFCADPKSGPCPCYNVGDEFVFCRVRGDEHKVPHDHHLHTRLLRGAHPPLLCGTFRNGPCSRPGPGRECVSCSSFGVRGRGRNPQRHDLRLEDALRMALLEDCEVVYGIGDKSWKMKRTKLSKRASTRWDELMVVK